MISKVCFFVFPFLVFSAASCSNPAKAEEFDRKNLFQAQFFHERGFTARALSHAKKIKKSSPRYDEAQEWVQRIEEENAEEEFGD